MAQVEPREDCNGRNSLTTKPGGATHTNIWGLIGNLDLGPFPEAESTF